MIIFYDHDGFIYQNVIPIGHTITATYYQNMLKKIDKEVNKVEGIFLHHDNAHPHVADVVADFLTKK